ncbi:Hok/Gef family protein [Rouxiella badensis]|nr:Hok/Gef family protein [Rouxiella badensis]MCC3718383.1 Hok/Gef family protein [Rouxiella badensis]MCC3726849.1 Hok/Gef family protein [Rouxiella badensis]MCC3731867.1 Hok/Gef family protein [Rouxiella badensis]MCC3738802.1 Hok/Gef family protein [Rouxiella badensis]
MTGGEVCELHIKRGNTEIAAFMACEPLR